MSKHQALVVPIKLEKHPNADSLSIVRVFGWTICVRTDDWKGIDRGIYIEPDTLVPTTMEPFKFLDRGDGSGYERIRARKLRGVVSYGLLIPAPANAEIGEDFWDYLQLKRYEPPEPMSTGGDNEKDPPGYFPTYDVESFEKYFKCFEENEEIIATEKIHGSNGRFRFDPQENRFYCGSRTNWKKQDEKSVWWKALNNHPEIQEFLRNHPDITIYGEVYGQVQKFKYGIPNTCKILIFDMLCGTRWLNFDEARSLAPDLPWVPIVYRGSFNFTKLKELANGPSLVEGAENIREGIVVKPVLEKYDKRMGRVQAKIISADYFLGKKGK